MRRLDRHDPARGQSQRDRSQAFPFKIGQGPRYARTDSPLGAHVGLDLTIFPSDRIPQKGDLSNVDGRAASGARALLELTDYLEDLHEGSEQ